MNNKYRNDIDGLRGICVAAVLGFHIFPTFIPAGYLGVDIFFGISGYLICQLILRQLHGGNFSVFGFFASRIRRIFPALLLVFLFCAVTGSILLPFDEYRQLNLHIATGSVFSSNFLLANELGYFDTASARKPLLHLWSLAVEEQFYVIFPFVILLMYRSRLRIGLAIFTFAISSYAAGVYTAQGDADGAYFYSWCRFYEILAGAALAVGASSNATSIKSASRTIKPYLYSQIGRLLWSNDAFFRHGAAWSVLGFCMILASFYTFDHNSPIPGPTTLVPLTGLLLLLACGPNAWANRHILASHWLVALGKISYPLYLWHWPIWVFLTIKIHNPIWAGILAITISFILAILTYQYVERPVRNGRLMTSKAYVLVLLMVIAGVVSLRTYETGMFRIAKNETGLDSKTLILYQQITNQVNTKINWTPERKKIIIFGDSQAQDLFSSWKNDTGVGLMMINSGYFCSAFRYPDKDQTRHLDYCKKQFELLVNSTEIQEADLLVYTHLWRDREEYVPGYQESLDRIREANPKLSVYFMGPKPIIWKSYVTINAIMLDYKPTQSINDYLNRVRDDNSSKVSYARGIADKLNIGFIDAIPILCKESCELHSGTEHYYYDQSHWTPAGTRHFYERAAPILSQLVNKNSQ